MIFYLCLSSISLGLGFYLRTLLIKKHDEDAYKAKLIHEERIRRYELKIYDLEIELRRAEKEFNNLKEEAKKEAFFKIIKEKQNETGQSKALLNFL